MKVIFLDIDGVLNCQSFFANEQRPISGPYAFLDKNRLLLLHAIVSQTDAKIILSSTWKVSLNKKLQAQDLMGTFLLDALNDVHLQLFDKTEQTRLPRGDEIRRWLFLHPEVTHFIILDDLTEIDANWQELTPHLVQTDYFNGLTATLTQIAIKKLS